MRPGPVPAPRICARCHVAPAIPSRPGLPRCEACAALPPLLRSRPPRTGSRGATIAREELTRAVMAVDALTDEDRAALGDRPRTRGDCIGGPRPCPWVGCKHSLYLDVSPDTGSLKLNFPGIEPDELEHSCALDVADAGAATLEDVGQRMNLKRERIRQIEINVLVKLGPRLGGVR